MTDEQLDRIRERLLEERQERIDALVEFDERFKQRLETGTDDLSKYPQHMADDGTETIEQEKDFLLASQEGRQLLDIDESLRTLYKEPDRFGRCERCGTDIGMERLELVPWARLCIDCKKETEAAGGAPAA